MKKAAVKSLSLLIALVMLLTSFGAASLTANAAVKEKLIKGVWYEYRIKDGKSIVTNAFVSGNSAGKTITIPSKLGGKRVVAIEGMSMETKNTKTTALVFPDSIERIGTLNPTNNYMPFSITNLTTVKLGKNVKVMKYNPFCSSVKKFVVNSKNKYFKTSNGILYNKKGTKLVAYPARKSGKTFTVPKKVKTIGIGAFSNTENLLTVKTNKTSTVSTRAFMYSSVKTVILGSAVKTASGDAFCEGTSISEIKVAKSNRYFTVKDGVLFNKKKTKIVAYPYAKKGKSYTIPSTVKVVGNSAFYIGNLNKITVPDSVTVIQDFAFGYSFANVNLPSNVTKVGDYAYAATTLKKAVFNSSELTLGAGAFASCDMLKAVDLSKTKVKALPDFVFSGTTALETVSLPETLEVIGEAAFNESGVKSLELPASVKTVKSFALWEENLKTLVVNGKETAFDEDAIMPTDSNYSEDLNTIVVKGLDGSKAQAYAAKFGFTFEVL
ncbi:MAG: leucine-rich repeat protein [Eubacterium sp.]|nr:leucine-rich repeat protein [Eubacterium sp.]